MTYWKCKGDSAKAVREPRIMLFLLFFFTFTQYDIELAGGRLNYLLTTVPLLLLFGVVSHGILFRGVLIRKSTLPLFVMAILLFPWVLLSSDILSLANYIMLFLALASAAITAYLSMKYPYASEAALRSFIWMSVVSILLQLLYYWVMGEQIDLHHMLFPFSRHSEITAIHGFGFLRFNGFHLEPGSYAANVGIAGLLYIGIFRRVPLLMVGMVLLTLLVTRSASAVLYFGALALIVYVKLLQNNATRTIFWTPFLVVALIGFVLISGFDDYIENRFQEQSVLQNLKRDGSMRMKVANIEHLQNASPARLLLGSGFMFVDCSACGFVNSNGAAFAMVFFFGLGGILLILFFLRLGASRSWVGLLMVCVLLFSRHTFVQPNFWLPMALMLSQHDFGRVEYRGGSS